MEDKFVACDEENALGATSCWVHNQWHIVIIVIYYSDTYVRRCWNTTVS